MGTTLFLGTFHSSVDGDAPGLWDKPSPARLPERLPSQAGVVASRGVVGRGQTVVARRPRAHSLSDDSRPCILAAVPGNGRRFFVSAVTEQAKVGVIGGSGFYELLDDAREVKLETPFGAPSDSFFVGDLGGVSTAFLPRHARGHRILPSEVNYRANIWGMMLLGVVQIVSASAVSSLREELKPLDIVVPDQLFDRTKARPSTFFGEGIVVHMGFADPFCPHVSQAIAAGGRAVGATIHEGGTYVCIEGPQFSTRAESQVYRQWGMDVIGMTNLQEAKLAREAEICYATMALVTDYDVWYAGEE